MSGLPKSIISVADYLKDESERNERHEYLGGVVYPVVENVTRNHDRILKNLNRKIDDHLEGGPCERFGESVKIHVQSEEGEDFYYYPDSSVTCDPEDSDPNVVESPKLLVEVISQSTERIDTREKWIFYRYNPSVDEILLLEQDRPGGRVARRQNEQWIVEILEDPEAVLSLKSIDLEIPLKELYKGVSWMESSG